MLIFFDAPPPIPPALTVEHYQEYAITIAKRAGFDPDIFYCQIEQESQWDPHAVSPAGAVGIAQIVPRWHPSVINPFDPFESMDYAAHLMAAFLRQFGSHELALAAYNAGPGNAAHYKQIPETAAYVHIVLTCAAKRNSVRREIAKYARDSFPLTARNAKPDYKKILITGSDL